MGCSDGREMEGKGNALASPSSSSSSSSPPPPPAAAARWIPSLPSTLANVSSGGPSVVSRSAVVVSFGQRRAVGAFWGEEEEGEGERGGKWSVRDDVGI